MRSVCKNGWCFLLHGPWPSIASHSSPTLQWWAGGYPLEHRTRRLLLFTIIYLYLPLRALNLKQSIPWVAEWRIQHPTLVISFQICRFTMHDSNSLFFNCCFSFVFFIKYNNFDSVTFSKALSTLCTMVLLSIGSNTRIHVSPTLFFPLVETLIVLETTH